MRKTSSLIIVLLTVLVLFSCKKAYKATLTNSSTNFLAVDGTIVSGDSTFVSLSRATAISDTTRQKVELKAVVAVENDLNVMYPFKEKGQGVYVLGTTNFDPARTYRLDIKTTDGKIYQSDFVPVKTTPPIDSIYFKQNSDSTVRFFVNTHDPTNNTRYYRWDYKETWSSVSLITSNYKFVGGQILPIILGTPDDFSKCYATAPSNQIVVGSSATLTNDVIVGQPFGGLPAGSEKITRIYVLQLHQYALTKAGFDYYQNLKTNTQNLGSIFDAQPSTIFGNIHCITSPGDMVIGFVSASTVTTKQLTQRRNDFPFYSPDPSYGSYAYMLYYNNYYFGLPSIPQCATGQISTSPYSTFTTRLYNLFATPGMVLLARIPFLQTDAPGANFVEPDRSAGTGYVYYYAPYKCADCRIRGYSNIRPSYFPPY